jgi:hypothetical protein
MHTFDWEGGAWAPRCPSCLRHCGNEERVDWKVVRTIEEKRRQWWSVRKKVYGTRYSQAVTHPSTNRARRCLTSVIGREPVLSTWYGRRRYGAAKLAIHTDRIAGVSA